ncbi:DUF3019 domain-containing protein [Pseudoalteromonas sp. JBTF-M23]|uniref:DUF3019 domain-containing protein n=1 Tax=Pseudoalteromonas caenipelagi TaxID=2726988 RepID=A0A849VDH9_9GAMM|nr:DUF3019 domain-containing protein [Pseudoalteromonas caenipelagi]NOU51452.1 DUF3019 domain-containing protein [Pseudoalteromonas caenipelagi]
MKLIQSLTLQSTFVTALLLGANGAQANNIQNSQVLLHVSPKQCTTLEKGQDCYVNLKVSWQTPTKGDFCLAMAQQPLHCWHDQNQGQFEQELIINTPVSINLLVGDKILQSASIKYAWLYKNRISKTVRWRMF